MFISSSFYPRFILLFVCVFYKLNKWKDCVLRKQGDGRKNCKLFSRCASAAAAAARGWVIWKNFTPIRRCLSSRANLCPVVWRIPIHSTITKHWKSEARRKRERERQSDTPFSIRNIFYTVMTNAHDFSLSRDETTFLRQPRGRARWGPAGVRVLKRDGGEENIRWKSFCINFPRFSLPASRLPKFSHRKAILILKH